MTRLACRLFVAFFALGLAVAQDKEPPPDPALPDQLKELKSMVKDLKMREDFRAIGLIQQLTRQPDNLNKKDRAKIAKAVGDVFRIGKVRAAGEDHLYREAGDALSRLEEDGAKALAKALEDKRIEDNLKLRAHLIEALGRTKDEKQVEWLLEVATRAHQDELRAAAGSALGNYADIDAKAQRDIVKTMIRAWGALHSKATQPINPDPNAPVDFGPQNAQRTLRAIEAKWVRSLRTLTGQNLSKFMDWQHWLNKNPRWEPPAKK